MAFRKYQSIENFDSLKGEQKEAAQRVSSIKSKLEDDLTDQDRRDAENRLRLASAKLA